MVSIRTALFLLAVMVPLAGGYVVYRWSNGHYEMVR